MSTLIEYANRRAAGDTGPWRAAVLRIAELVSKSYWYDAPGTYPNQEMPFDAGALLLFALANQRQVDPAELGEADVRAWLDERPLGAWIEDLAALFIVAGIDLPPRRSRNDRQPTGDPLVDTWTNLTCLAGPDPDPGDFFGSSGLWSEPILLDGLSAWQPWPFPDPRKLGFE